MINSSPSSFVQVLPYSVLNQNSWLSFLEGPWIPLNLAGAMCSAGGKQWSGTGMITNWKLFFQTTERGKLDKVPFLSSPPSLSQFCMRNPWELWKVYSLCICRMTSKEVTATPKACVTLAGAGHSRPATSRWLTVPWRVRKVTGLARRFSHPVAVCFGTNLETLTQRPANKLHGVCMSYIHRRDRQMPSGKKKKEKWTQLLRSYKMFCSLPYFKIFHSINSGQKFSELSCSVGLHSNGAIFWESLDTISNFQNEYALIFLLHALCFFLI